MKEIWKDVKGYEGSYQVSNKGRVKALNRYITKIQKGCTYNQFHKEKILAQRGTKYRMINLAGRTFYVHRLVASAFCVKSGNVVMHLDSNPQNNNSENLKWGTQYDNMQQCINEGKHYGKNRKGSYIR